MKASNPSDSPRGSVPFEELLSAYHDGELSPQEREAVERQLASSPKARRQLQQLERMSGLLHELPQPQLPQEFSRQVLRQAEQEMLIPKLRGAVPVARRRWPLFLAGLTTTAALLFIGVLLVMRASQEGRQDAHVADRGVVAKTTPLAEPPAAPISIAAESDHKASQDQSRTVIAREKKDDRSSRMVALNQTTSMASTGVAHDSPAAQPEGVVGSAKAAAPAQSGPSHHEISDSVNEQIPPRVYLKAFKEGGVYDIARVSKDQKALRVHVVVLDMRDGREAVLQVLKIVEDQGGDVDGVLFSDENKRDLKPGEHLVAQAPIDGSHGILVETTSDKVPELLKGLLKRQQMVADVQMDEVEIASLTPPTPPTSNAPTSLAPGSTVPAPAAPFSSTPLVSTTPLSTPGAVADPPKVTTKSREPGESEAKATPPVVADARAEESQTKSDDKSVGEPIGRKGFAARKMLARSSTTASAGSDVRFKNSAGKPVEDKVMSSRHAGGAEFFVGAKDESGNLRGRDGKSASAAPSMLATKKLESPTRMRARLVQILPDSSNRKVGKSQARRSIKTPAATLRIEPKPAAVEKIAGPPLLPGDVPFTAKAKLPTPTPAAVPAPAVPPLTASTTTLPIQILFVVEKQSQDIPIDGPAKGKK